MSIRFGTSIDLSRRPNERRVRGPSTEAKTATPPGRRRGGRQAKIARRKARSHPGGVPDYRTPSNPAPVCGGKGAQDVRWRPVYRRRLKMDDWRAVARSGFLRIVRTRLAACTFLLLGCLAAPASPQKVPRDAAVGAGDPGRWKLQAFDHRGQLCYAFLSAEGF